MTKKVWTAGELITKTELDKLLQDLKSEPLYGGVATKTADYVITDTDDLAVVIADGNGATVEITLPAATGSGRIIMVVASDVSNAVTLIRAGADVIEAAGVTYTFTPAWEVAHLVDIGSGQWATLFATATLT
ncbi:hypothetical protein LCGC14_1288950 [marine sediment metagenome]|uniref:Uncharacterized protein n=1 Tax=marine sediment metagenome TaxID=412755 RepID=A0A0F9N9L8_9ZZZZ